MQKICQTDKKQLMLIHIQMQKKWIIEKNEESEAIKTA